MSWQQILFLTGTICSSKVLSRCRCFHFGLTVTQTVKKAVKLYSEVLIQNISKENIHMFLWHKGVTGRLILAISIVLGLPWMLINQVSFKLLFWYNSSIWVRFSLPVNQLVRVSLCCIVFFHPYSCFNMRTKVKHDSLLYFYQKLKLDEPLYRILWKWLFRNSRFRNIFTCRANGKQESTRVIFLAFQFVRVYVLLLKFSFSFVFCS